MSATSPSTSFSIAGRQSILSRLADSRRTFDRLDWWSVSDWAGSPALLMNDDSALLIVPPDIGPAQALHESRTSAAWVRWCAVSDGTSASPVLPRLLNQAHEALRQTGVQETWAIVHPQDWLLTYLQDAGYETIDRMLTYEISPRDIVVPPVSTELTLWPMQASELHIAENLDARSFEPPWRYPPAVMQPAFAACAVFTWAAWKGAPAGYCCALLNGDHGHVVRLAIAPQHRRAGLGAALLGDVVKALGRQGAMTVSLNTQGTNKISQRLYRRMGFNEMLERPMVLQKKFQNALHDGRAGA